MDIHEPRLREPGESAGISFGGAGDHEGEFDARRSGYDVFDQVVSDILLLRIAAQVQDTGRWRDSQLGGTEFVDFPVA